MNKHFEKRFLSLKDYFIKNGNLKIPVKHDLYAMLINTRTNAKKGVYSSEELSLLRSIGFVENMHKEDFLNNVNIFEEFIQNNKRVPKSKEGDIGCWYFHLKKKISTNKLNDYERVEIERLQNLYSNINLFVSFQDTWDKEFRLYKNHVDNGGTFYTTWFKNQKSLYKKGNLNEDRTTLLKSIAAPLDNNIKVDFREKLFEELLIYKKEHKNMEIPLDYISLSGYPLGKKYMALRARFNNSDSKVNLEYIGKLKKHGLFISDYKSLNKSAQNASSKKPITNTSGFVGVHRVNEYVKKNGEVSKPYVIACLKFHKIFHCIGKYEDSNHAFLQGAIDRDLYIIKHNFPHTRNFTDMELINEVKKRTSVELAELKGLLNL